MAVNPNIDLTRGPDLGASIESSVATDQTKSEQPQASAEKAGTVERGLEKERELPGPEADREQGRETEIPPHVRDQVAALELDKHHPGADGPGQGQGQGRDPHEDRLIRQTLHMESYLGSEGIDAQGLGFDQMQELMGLDRQDMALASASKIGAGMETQLFGWDVADRGNIGAFAPDPGGKQREPEIMMG